MSPMHPLQLRTSEEAIVRLMTINKRSSEGSLIPFYVIYIFYFLYLFCFVCFALCLCFSDFNKGEWRSLGYDLMKLLTLEGTSRE